MAVAAGGSGEAQSEREITTSRVFDAPREAVFDAWCDPQRLARWWGPRELTRAFEACEPRAGGTWRFVTHGPDGRTHRDESLFVEVTRPERITVLHISLPRFRLMATFAEADGRTRLTWRMRFDSAAECERVREAVVPASEESLDRLEAELARGAAAS